MKEPESPIMAKILIRFNFETEIYVRYRSEEIAPGIPVLSLSHQSFKSGDSSVFFGNPYGRLPRNFLWIFAGPESSKLLFPTETEAAEHLVLVSHKRFTFTTQGSNQLLLLLNYAGRGSSDQCSVDLEKNVKLIFFLDTISCWLSVNPVSQNKTWRIDRLIRGLANYTSLSSERKVNLGW